jgi:hypothetical protein
MLEVFNKYQFSYLFIQRLPILRATFWLHHLTLVFRFKRQVLTSILLGIIRVIRI